MLHVQQHQQYPQPQQQQHEELAHAQQQQQRRPVHQQQHHRQQHQGGDAHSHHHSGVMKASGCKKGGRPVTWIGGGGMDPKKLAGMGVPMLRTLFSQVFGQPTASNNASWLRRKLSETPDSVHGQRRSPVVRARDSGAAIWNQDECDEPLEGPDRHPLLLDRGAATEAQPVTMLPGSGMVPLLQSAGTTAHHAARGAASPPASGASSGSGAWAHCGKRDRLGAVLAASHSLAAAFGSRSRQPMAAAAAAASAAAAAAAMDEGAARYASGVPIRADAIDASGFAGRRVLVYWPADCQWWEATVRVLDAAGRRVQLLYADQTEETIAGRDFDELLRNEHLLLALTGAQQQPASGSGAATSSDTSQQQVLHSRPLQRAPTAPAALLAADGGPTPSLLADLTSNSSGRSTGAALARSLSASLATAGTSSDPEDAAIMGPAAPKRPRTLLAAAAQQPRQSPGSSAGDAAINSASGMDMDGARGGFAAAQPLQQQQQWLAGADAAHLGATFANQQLQQLHLQQQAQMQLAAEHYLLQQQQQQQMAVLAPTNAAAAAAAAAAMQAALDSSPTAAMAAAAAAAAGKCAMLACSAQLEHEARAQQMQAAVLSQQRPASPRHMQPSLLPAQLAAGAPANPTGAGEEAPGASPAASKTVRIKLQPEYFFSVPAAHASSTGQQQQQQLGAARPRTPALPAISGATAMTGGRTDGQALSGFTGGAFRYDAFDEVDTLLSAPSNSALFGGWEDGGDGDDGMPGSGGDGVAALLPPCSGGGTSPHGAEAAGCVRQLLHAASPAADCAHGGHTSCCDEEMSSGSERASEDGSGAFAQRGCRPMLDAAAGADFLDAVAGALGCCMTLEDGAARAGGRCVEAPEEAEGVNAALAHVFDYA